MARKPVPSSPTTTATTTEAAATQAPVQQMGCLALVARLTWLVFGNLALFVVALYLTQRAGFSAVDVVFLVLSLGLIGVRYLDVTRFGGFTSDGKPSTLADWRRYAVKMAAISVVAYGGALALRGVLA